MPEMMKAAIYYNNDKIRIEERPIPEIGPGDLLIKTAACGLCGSESMEWYQLKRAPKVMGHEPAGIVAKAGSEVKGFKEGDRVFVNHHVGRIHSHLALRGHFTSDPFYSSTNLEPGAMCEYFRAPAVNVETDTHLIPDKVSFEAATFMEPWGCVLGGLKVAGIQYGDTVAVVGAGFMGQGFVHLAPLFGAGAIIALDLSDFRLSKAGEMGATHTINPEKEDPKEVLYDLNHGRGADSVILTVPSISALEMAYDLVGVGGTLHLNAPPSGDRDWKLNPTRMYFDEITITNKYSADHHDTYQILKWLEAGRIRPEAAITHRFALEDVGRAFKLLVKADKSIKTMIYPNGYEFGGLEES